jgi:cytochrome c-type biogenesis protein CcmH/NrfG
MMDTPTYHSLLDDAKRAWRNGELDVAEHSGRQALALAQSDAEAVTAWCMLGRIAGTQGKFAEANDAFISAAERAAAFGWWRRSRP